MFVLQEKLPYTHTHWPTGELDNILASPKYKFASYKTPENEI